MIRMLVLRNVAVADHDHGQERQVRVEVREELRNRGMTYVIRIVMRPIESPIRIAG